MNDMNKDNVNKPSRSGLCARLSVVAVALSLAAGAVPAAQADSALEKAGKAIQYPVRKAGENVSKSTHHVANDVQYGTRKNAANVSVNAHRATGHNSVVRRKNGARRHNTVVTPQGHLYRLPDQK